MHLKMHMCALKTQLERAAFHVQEQQRQKDREDDRSTERARGGTGGGDVLIL